MGTKFRQQRTSIYMPRFEASNTEPEERSGNSFSIPVPMRISQPETRNENTNRYPFNEPQIVNEHFIGIQTSRQSDSPSPVEPTLAPPPINNEIQQKRENKPTQQQIIARNVSHVVSPDVSKHHQTMKGDVIVLSRSVVDLNDQRHLRNHSFSSIELNRTIVEHNGKQFVVELNERTERRYVQYIDEMTHKKRVFEVTDRVPCRIIRPYKHTSESLSKDGTVQNALRSTLRSNQQSAHPSIINNRLEKAASSNSINNKRLSYNNVNVPSTSNISETIYQGSSTFSSRSQSRLPSPRLLTRSATSPIDSRSRKSQPNLLGYSSPKLQNVSKQYSSKPSLVQPPSFRAHTPTNSDYSASSSETDSSDSDEETETEDNDQVQRSNENDRGYERTNPFFSNNRNSTALASGTVDPYRSSTLLDPFARSGNPMESHHYRQRPDINKYAEPMMNNRKFQQSTHSDYAPIPVTIKQPDQNQDSRSNDSNKNVFHI